MRCGSIFDSAAEALRVFHTFDDGEPESAMTGIRAVDRAVGGMYVGSAGVLGGATGVGKTSIVSLSAMQRAKMGLGTAIISTEDGPDILGSRVLAELSGVNSLDIRRKAVGPAALEKLRDAHARLKDLPIHISYSRSLPDILADIPVLAAEGADFLWMDYIQKVRGVSDDRRAEVGRVFVTIQNKAAEHGMATMFTSQFPRKDPAERPQIWWLKESGDLENESKLIILLQRDVEHGLLHGRIAKSTFGEEGVSFSFRRNSAGVLEELGA